MNGSATGGENSRKGSELGSERSRKGTPAVLYRDANNVFGPAAAPCLVGTWTSWISPQACRAACPRMIRT